MLDRHLRPRIDPALTVAGGWLARRGVTAGALTLLGALLGLGAGGAVALGAPLAALALLLASRLADGLDGPVARAAGQGGPWGAHLDILADFVTYAALPLGFVLADPVANGAAGAFLLAAYYVNAASFLGHAILAEQRGLTSLANGRKGFFHATGLLEGTETIAFMVALCLLPGHFAPMAWGFGALCLLTAALRTRAGRAAYAQPPGPPGSAPLTR